MHSSRHPRSRIKYPTSLFCLACKASIELDFEGRLYKTMRHQVATDDLLGMMIYCPSSRKSAKDAKENKQDIDYNALYILICQHCHTILGTR